MRTPLSFGALWPLRGLKSIHMFIVVCLVLLESTSFYHSDMQTPLSLVLRGPGVVLNQLTCSSCRQFSDSLCALSFNSIVLIRARAKLVKLVPFFSSLFRTIANLVKLLLCLSPWLLPISDVCSGGILFTCQVCFLMIYSIRLLQLHTLSLHCVVARGGCTLVRSTFSRSRRIAHLFVSSKG